MPARLAVAIVLGLLALSPAAGAQTQPPLDIKKLDYSPIGFFKPGDPVPPSFAKACDEAAKPLLKGKIFNPSGKWNSHDNNVFEELCLPYRQSGDTTNNDPMGPGADSPGYGFCGGRRTQAERPGNQAYQTGVCANHQLEYVEYYEETMKAILGDFGVTTARYEFEIDPGATPVLTNTLKGKGINPAAIVPGADHPEQTVVIGAHFDQTNDGPTSVWDSAEGHAEIIRVAAIMADYWRKTGTRPSATVKFVPWDGEESGTLGSLDYVLNNVVPGEENNVRGYWNTDPCAGGYPSFQFGIPGRRITMGVQLASPAFIGQNATPVADPDLSRIERFNARAPQLIEDVLDNLDDKIESMAGQPELFISKNEGTSDLGGPIQIGFDDPVLFGSDWVNFVSLGIPFFNPGPETTGPNQSNDDLSQPSLPPNPNGTADALTIFHTPNDNFPFMNRYTGGDPSGMKWSESWIKGMEFCSHMLSWGMLQHDQGGAQTATTDPVAYYEALPNEATTGKRVNFDGTASYQYEDVATRKLVDPAKLQYKWDFGDGTAPAFGRTPKHVYKKADVYKSKLTVTNRETGKSDTMSVPITVEDGDGSDTDPAGQNVDSQAAAASKDPVAFQSQGSPVACMSTSGFATASVKPAGKGFRIDSRSTGNNPIVAELFLASKGSRAFKGKKVATFVIDKGTFTFNGKLKKGKLKKGAYFVRLASKAGSKLDQRFFGLQRTGSKFRSRKAFTIKDTCELISLYRLRGPVFGKTGKFGIGFSVTQPAKVTVSVFRGKSKKAVKTFSRTISKAGKFEKFNLSGRKLKRGEYRFVLKAVAGKTTKTATVYASRI